MTMRRRESGPGSLDCRSRNRAVIAQVLPDSSDDIRPSGMDSRQIAVSSSSCGNVHNDDGINIRSVSESAMSHEEVEGRQHLQQLGQNTDGGNGIEEILSNLDAFADTTVVSSLSDCLPPDGDHQLVELNQLITELEQLQEFNAQALQLGNGAAAKTGAAEDVVEVHTRDFEKGEENVAMSQGKDKVKSHPAMVALLMNGGMEPNEPFKPLKEKPFKHQADMEGSVLYLKNAEKRNISLLSAASNVGTGESKCITAGHSAIDDEVSDSTMAAGSLPNLMLGQGQLLTSGHSQSLVSTSTAQSLKDADNVINQMKQQCGTLLAAELPDDEFSLRNQRYWSMIEEKLRVTIAQNQRLANLNVQLHAENYQLNKELSHHKAVLANQSTIADAVQGLQNVSSSNSRAWSHAPKHDTLTSSRPDDPAESVKRFKALDEYSVEGLPLGGVCLHINPDSKKALVELCHHCMNVSGRL